MGRFWAGGALLGMWAGVAVVSPGSAPEVSGAFQGDPVPKEDFREALGGPPRDFKGGEVTGYALWHDAKGWHLRTAARQKTHRFSGGLYVQNGYAEGGTFSEVRSPHPGKGGALAKHWKVSPKRDELSFDFSAGGVVDGIDFTLSKAAFQLQVDLRLDGKAAFERVFIGVNGTHPPQMPFLLPAHPRGSSGARAEGEVETPSGSPGPRRRCGRVRRCSAPSGGRPG